MSFTKLVVVCLLAALVGIASGSKEETETQTQFNLPERALQPADSNFNPDAAEGMDYTQVYKEFGDVPKIEGEIQLGGVSKAFENEYWRILKQGMETAADKWKQRGYQLAIEVRSAQGEGDEQGQLAVVKNMINQKYSALLLSPISDGNLVPGFQEALKKGIPVINVNDGIIAETPYFVGPRAIQNGELAAAWIAEKINGVGEVAVIVGTPKAFAARQRTLGFENWMKNSYPNISVVAKQNADWDRLRAKELADIWIRKYPNLKAIFANNDTMALGAQEAVNVSGADILVVGVDGIQEAYASIRRGELDATVDSFPLYKGQIAVEAALRVLGGQDLPRVIWTPQALIDLSNVDTPAEEIIDWEER